MTTTPTVAEMIAQREALDRQIEAAEITPLEAILSALDKPTVHTALATLQEQIGNLTGDRQVQANNLITVLTHSPAFLRGQLEGIQARQHPPGDEA